MSVNQRLRKRVSPAFLARFSVVVMLAVLALIAGTLIPRTSKWQVVEAQASCTPVTVPGTADIYLAGMPNGSTADQLDTAPAQSPLQVTGAISGGSVISITSATGSVTHGPLGGCCQTTGPEGGTPFAHMIGAQNGISNIIAPINALIGVFLGPDAPNGSPAPAALDFSSLVSREYTTLNPLLKQVFFIGDGKTSGLQVQQIIAPVGATRLFLGTMDGFDNLNNVGSYAVTVCITPCVNPPNITVGNAAGLCSAVVNYPAGSGLCAITTCTPPTGSTFPVGTTVVTCSTTGGSSVGFSVTVTDTQPPTITCPPSVTATSSTVTYPPPTTSDNCSGVTVTCNPPSGSSFPPGVTTVTCTARDASNNTANCSFTVTVNTGDVCLQDDENLINIIRVNLTTGAYQFTSCQMFDLSGTGVVRRKGCNVTVEDIRPDRRVQIQVETCLRRGTAGVQSFTAGKTYTITDRNIDNNPCICTPGG